MKRSLLKFITGAALAAFVCTASAAETVKVGVLHSLSGTMAISETVGSPGTELEFAL